VIDTGIGGMDNYKSLQNILQEAYLQAAEGKGKERHANGEPFEEQLICQIGRLGLNFCLGQAVKKIVESGRLEGERGVKELLGAINYISAEIITRREKI